jgi:hypothetical protein
MWGSVHAPLLKAAGAMGAARARLACLWALAVHASAHAASAPPRPPSAARLVRGCPALSRGSPAAGARARALLATLEGDAPLGLRRAAQVSDHGRFRSAGGVVHCGTLTLRGYRCVMVDRKSYLLHRLVCTAWHGPPPTPEHTRAIHKDLDPSNSQPDNLEWATPAESIQRSHDNNPNRKSNAGAMSKPVRGRKQGTADEWTQFESGAAAARELGPGFNPGNILSAANGRYTHTRGWTFEFTQQYEEIEGEQWRTVVLDGAESGAQVSDRGRFRDTRGVVKDAPGRGIGAAPGASQVQVNGANYMLHRLVCTAWHGPPPTPEHTHVHHKDLDPSNSQPDNLEWATPAESIQRSHDNNPNRKSHAGATSKPVRGRKQGTADEWTHFESCIAAARELGPGFHPASIGVVANGRYTHMRGWTFEFTQQYEEIAGEVWKNVVLPSTKSFQETVHHNV